MSNTTVPEQDHMDAAAPEPSASGTLAEAGAASVVDPTRVQLFRGPHGILRATIDGDRSVLRAKVVCAFPLSDQHRYLSILDGKGKEACLIESVDRLDAASQRLVAEELARFYRVSTISRIHRVRTGVPHVQVYGGTCGRSAGDATSSSSGVPDTVLPLSSGSCRPRRSMVSRTWIGNRFIIPDIDETAKRPAQPQVQGKGTMRREALDVVSSFREASRPPAPSHFGRGCRLILRHSRGLIVWDHLIFIVTHMFPAGHPAEGQWDYLTLHPVHSAEAAIQVRPNSSFPRTRESTGRVILWHLAERPCYHC